MAEVATGSETRCYTIERENTALVLTAIMESAGEASHQNIAEAIENLSGKILWGGNLSRMLCRLTSEGLVESSYAPTGRSRHGRKKIYEVTLKGIAEMRSCAEYFKSRAEIVERVLGPPVRVPSQVA